MSGAVRVLERDRPTNQVLRFLLAAITVVVVVWADFKYLLFVYPVGVDLEIPLRAAERWRSGGSPYLATAFTDIHGATQPFLYPPYVLPPLALLVDLPRAVVVFVWLCICAAAAMFVLRRLAFPVWTWPFVMAWPPMLEPLIGGNVQLPAIAMFAAVFWHAPTRLRSMDLIDRDLRRARLPTGMLAAAGAALKVSQPHAWLAVLGRNPRVAVLGAGAVTAFAGLSLVVTGVDVWRAWLEQLQRANDPSWDLGGFALARMLHPVVGLVVALASLVYVVVARPRANLGAWVGVASVVGATSLHSFGLLFLVPAMLVIRREIALVAAMVIATTTYQGAWAGILIVTVSMTAALRYPSLLETRSDGAA